MAATAGLLGCCDAVADDARVSPKIASARYDTLILATDGSVWGCSGWDGNYTSGPNGIATQQLPAGAANWISAGDHYGFANALAAGSTSSGALGTDTSNPAYGSFRAVPPIVGRPVAGGSSGEVTFYIAKGQLYAAGKNRFGNLGTGLDPALNSNVFSPVVDVSGQPLRGVRAVAEGARASVALLRDGTVWTWGDNLNGQLGDQYPDPVSRNYAAQVTSLAGTRIVAVAANIDAYHGSLNGDHFLALAEDGTVWAWGENGDGQSGNGSIAAPDAAGWRYPQAIPTQVRTSSGELLEDIVAIAAGGAHSLALQSDGHVWSWGYNGSGQLGVGPASETPVTQAVRVPGLRDIVTISAGPGSSFAVARDGSAWAWGWNYREDLCIGPGYFPADGSDWARLSENNIGIPTRMIKADGTLLNLGPAPRRDD